jgi:hypothetical protein
MGQKGTRSRIRIRKSCWIYVDFSLVDFQSIMSFRQFFLEMFLLIYLFTVGLKMLASYYPKPWKSKSQEVSNPDLGHW